MTDAVDDPIHHRIRDWFAMRGDQTLRSDFNLSPTSVVLDIGGFHGDYAAEIHQRTGATVHIFEPIPAFADTIAERFTGNPKIHLHRFGLGAEDGTLTFSQVGDATSAFREGGEQTTAPVRSIARVIAELKLREIHLLTINAEGAEYEILNALIKANLIGQVRELQVQFHDVIPDAQAEMMAIRRKLAATHFPTYMFGFVWENWRARDMAGAEDSIVNAFMTIDLAREQIRRQEQEIASLNAHNSAILQELSELREHCQALHKESAAASDHFRVIYDELEQLKAPKKRKLLGG